MLEEAWRGSSSIRNNDDFRACDWGLLFDLATLLPYDFLSVLTVEMKSAISISTSCQLSYGLDELVEQGHATARCEGTYDDREFEIGSP